MNDPGVVSIQTGTRIAARSTVWSLCIFSSLVILSGLSCIVGTFYDDEIYNIRQAALSFPDVWEYVKHINSRDIHPPISYLLNRFEFVVLGTWKPVHFATGVIYAPPIPS